MNTYKKIKMMFFMVALGILTCFYRVDALPGEFVDGWTTHIHQAVAASDLPALEALFAAGGDVNILDRNGDTPINIAAQDLNFKFIKFLLSRGADVTICNNAGDAPLHSVVKYEVASWKDTKLSLRLLELFIKQDDSVLAVKNSDNLTPLHLAADLNRYDAARLLLRFGANIEAGDLGARTPLHYAAAKGNKRIITFLLKNNANVDAENCLGERPLHRAVKGAHTDVVWLLLRYGANVNATAKELRFNNTPLHELAGVAGIKENDMSRFCNCALMLLRSGADPSIKNSDGKDPVRVAREAYNKPVAEFIKQYLAERRNGDEHDDQGAQAE